MLRGLTTLRVDGCEGVSSLRPLRVLRALTMLSLKNCTGITDLSPLSTCTTLSELYLDGCTITSVKPLQPCVLLSYLSLRKCKRLTDVRPLVSCPRLRTLDICGCPRKCPARATGVTRHQSRRVGLCCVEVVFYGSHGCTSTLRLFCYGPSFLAFSFICIFEMYL